MRTQNPNSDDVSENRIYLGLWTNSIQEAPSDDGYGLSPYLLAAASEPSKPSSRTVSPHLPASDACQFHLTATPGQSVSSGGESAVWNYDECTNILTAVWAESFEGTFFLRSRNSNYSPMIFTTTFTAVLSCMLGIPMHNR